MAMVKDEMGGIVRMMRLKSFKVMTWRKGLVLRLRSRSGSRAGVASLETVFCDRKRLGRFEVGFERQYR
jgi:hypothetical protein